MTFAIAGGAVMGIAHLNESLLERITRKYGPDGNVWSIS